MHQFSLDIDQPAAFSHNAYAGHVDDDRENVATASLSTEPSSEILTVPKVEVGSGDSPTADVSQAGRFVNSRLCDELGFFRI